MEKVPVEIDASNVAKPDASPKPSHQEDEPTTDYSSKATNKTSFSDYLVVFPPPELGCMLMSWQRIFTYSTLSDRIFLVLAALAEVGTGVTLPLMNIIFGKSLLCSNIHQRIANVPRSSCGQFQHIYRPTFARCKGKIPSQPQSTNVSCSPASIS
jgi:hypothetical protein